MDAPLRPLETASAHRAEAVPFRRRACQTPPLRAAAHPLLYYTLSKARPPSCYSNVPLGEPSPGFVGVPDGASHGNTENWTLWSKANFYANNHPITTCAMVSLSLGVHSAF